MGSNLAADRIYFGFFSTIFVHCSSLQGSFIHSDAIRKGKCFVFHLNVMVNGDVWLFEFMAM